jgi:hypothetical protein
VTFAFWTHPRFWRRCLSNLANLIEHHQLVLVVVEIQLGLG